MDPAYDWTRFTVHMYCRAPLDRVWSAWSTAAGLESFFIARATHTAADGTERGPKDEAQAGDAYCWDFCQPFQLRGAFRSVERPHRIAFSFGGMETTVSLRDAGDAVDVELHQIGCRTDDPGRVGDHLNCRSCWVFFLTNLKSVLESGTDLRDREHPARTDSVSVFWKGE